MINLTEIAITMMIIMLGDKIYEKYQPDQLEMHLSNGEISYVKINKKGYSCPKFCGAKHFHETTVSDNSQYNSNYKIFYDLSNSYLKLNGVNIINIFEIKTQKIKKNKKINTNREKVEIEKFINKITLN